MIHRGAYQASWPAAVERMVRDNEADRQGRLWAERMRRRAHGLPRSIVCTNNFWANFERCLREFNDAIEEGGYPDVTVDNVDKNFMEFLTKELLKDPTVRAAVSSERERVNASWTLERLLAQTVKVGREALAKI